MTSEEYVEAKGMKCPHCESEDIAGHDSSLGESGARQTMTCNACFSSWDDIYTLDCYVNLAVPEGSGFTPDIRTGVGGSERFD